MNKRDNILVASNEEQYALTIFYPSSYYYEGKLIVVYEDAGGDVDIKIMTPRGIVKNYPIIEESQLLEFIKEKEEENHDTE